MASVNHSPARNKKTTTYSTAINGLNELTRILIFHILHIHLIIIIVYAWLFQVPQISHLHKNLFENYGIQQDDNEAKIMAKIHLNFKLKMLGFNGLGLI